MEATTVIASLLTLILQHKQWVAGTVVWLVALSWLRDQDDELAQLYVLLSFFVLVFGAIGFTPRREGELSAYAHFNKNNQRLLGDLDPRRAGRELTGQSMLDLQGGGGGQEEEWERPPLPPQRAFGGQGQTLGGGRSTNHPDDDDEADLQRALLLSLREAREARAKKS